MSLWPNLQQADWAFAFRRERVNLAARLAPERPREGKMIREGKPGGTTVCPDESISCIGIEIVGDIRLRWLLCGGHNALKFGVDCRTALLRLTLRACSEVAGNLMGYLLTGLLFVPCVSRLINVIL